MKHNETCIESFDDITIPISAYRTMIDEMEYAIKSLKNPTNTGLRASALLRLSIQARTIQEYFCKQCGQRIKD